MGGDEQRAQTQPTQAAHCGHRTVPGGAGQSRRHGHRGQAIVEFALVAPVFFLMIFGVVEFSLIDASIGTFNFTANDDARLGSLLGRTDLNVDQEIVSQTRNRVVGVVAARTEKIEIFRSDLNGSAPSASAEDVYDIAGNAIGTATWLPADRNDSLGNADYLGVRITYEYTYITALVAGGNSTLQLTAQSIQRIEPQDFQGQRPHPSALLAARNATHVTVTIASASGGHHAPADDTQRPEAQLWLAPRNDADAHGGAQ